MVVQASTAGGLVMRARNEQRAAVVLTTLLPTQVRRRREGLRETLVRTVRKVDLRPPGLLLVHDAGVLELLDERFFPPMYS